MSPPCISPTHTASSFTSFYINIQFMNEPFNLAQLHHYITTHKPDIIDITETWLKPGVVDLLHGYEVVARYDRPDSSVSLLNHGGIILYRRLLGMPVSHISHSKAVERSWFVAHGVSGPISSSAVAACYQLLRRHVVCVSAIHRCMHDCSIKHAPS